MADALAVVRVLVVAQRAQDVVFGVGRRLARLGRRVEPQRGFFGVQFLGEGPRGFDVAVVLEELEDLVVM